MKGNLMKKMRNYSPAVLTFFGVAGVIGTAVLAASETPKAMKMLEEATDKKGEELSKLETVKIAGPVYIPAIGIGAATIISILGANVLNKRNQATLVSAYTLIQRSYTEYKDKLKEMYGEEVHNAIIDSIAVEKAEKVYISADCFGGSSSLDFDETDQKNMVRTFYDRFSDRYFESTTARVIEAEYHLNRNFCLGGSVPLNEFYEFLGIEGVDGGDRIGWGNGFYDSGVYWIDFDHRKITLDDGTIFYTIEMMFDPEIMEEE